ncbi:hypothetical protein AOQ84DRAFT_363085, partial [Glonium stellatum]
TNRENHPRWLHVKGSEYYDEIYAGARKKRDKYDGWKLLGGAPTSAFSTTQHDLHRVRRGALNPFFFKWSVGRLEPQIKQKDDRLCGCFVQWPKSREVVKLDVAFMALIMDVIMEARFQARLEENYPYYFPRFDATTNNPVAFVPTESDISQYPDKI